MRCPKCGYISFDQVEECLKCRKSIKGVSQILRGTAINAPAPLFLKFSTGYVSTADETNDIDDTPIDSFELEDPDLEILTVEPDDDDETDARLAGVNVAEVAQKQEQTIQEDEDTEFFILPKTDETELSQDKAPAQHFLADESPAAEDLSSHLQEKPVPASSPVLSLEKETDLRIDIPEELNDISDLAPPQEVAPLTPDGKINSMEDLDLNLELDIDFDLELEGFDDEPELEDSTQTDSTPQTSPIGRTEAIRRPAPIVNMDEELNFELDLGGLSLHKDQPAQK